MTIEEIKEAYEKTHEGDTIVQKSENVYGFENAEKREELREQYVKLLPKNQRLAILLHSKFCRSNHTDGCSFYYGIKELEDDWNEYAHKIYLKKADNLLAVTQDEKLLHDIINAITEY